MILSIMAFFLPGIRHTGAEGDLASEELDEGLDEGQAEAGVTSAGPVGVGVGAGVGAGLLIVMSPPVPGDAMSLGPQPASASALQPTSNRPWMFFTVISPS